MMRFSPLPLRTAGFTLIELLVVVTIAMLVLGGALAAFINFTDRRAVLNGVGELKTYLDRAQARARTGDVGGCDELVGYRVQTYLNNNVTELSFQAVCETGTPNTAQVVYLPSGVTVSPNLDLTFSVLNAGVDLGAASQDITVANDSHSYLFTLYQEGRMSEGDWQ